MNRTKKLERSGLWRTLKVVYLVIAILLFVAVINSSLNSSSNCARLNDPNITSGSRLAQAQLRQNLANNVKNCDEGAASAGAVAAVFGAAVGFTLGYFVFRRLLFYLIYGHPDEQQT